MCVELLYFGLQIWADGQEGSLRPFSIARTRSSQVERSCMLAPWAAPMHTGPPDSSCGGAARHAPPRRAPIVNNVTGRGGRASRRGAQRGNARRSHTPPASPHLVGLQAAVARRAEERDEAAAVQQLKALAHALVGADHQRGVVGAQELVGHVLRARVAHTRWIEKKGKYELRSSLMRDAIEIQSKNKNLKILNVKHPM
jgi:hypothetical protein